MGRESDERRKLETSRRKWLNERIMHEAYLEVERSPVPESPTGVPAMANHHNSKMAVDLFFAIECG